MIICLAGTKGGSGRSTTATNFACIAAGQGADVLWLTPTIRKLPPTSPQHGSRIIRKRQIHLHEIDRPGCANRGPGTCPKI